MKSRVKEEMLFKTFIESLQVTIRCLQFCGHPRAEYYLRKLRPIWEETQDDIATKGLL